MPDLDTYRDTETKPEKKGRKSRKGIPLKPYDKKKARQLHIDVTEEDFERLRVWSEKLGLGVSPFIRMTVLERMTILENQKANS